MIMFNKLSYPTLIIFLLISCLFLAANSMKYVNVTIQRANATEEFVVVTHDLLKFTFDKIDSLEHVIKEEQNSMIAYNQFLELKDARDKVFIHAPRLFYLTNDKEYQVYMRNLEKPIIGKILKDKGFPTKRFERSRDNIWKELLRRYLKLAEYKDKEVEVLTNEGSLLLSI